MILPGDVFPTGMPTEMLDCNLGEGTSGTSAVPDHMEISRELCSPLCIGMPVDIRTLAVSPDWTDVWLLKSGCNIPASGGSLYSLQSNKAHGLILRITG